MIVLLFFSFRLSVSVNVEVKAACSDELLGGWDNEEEEDEEAAAAAVDGNGGAGGISNGEVGVGDDGTATVAAVDGKDEEELATWLEPRRRRLEAEFDWAPDDEENNIDDGWFVGKAAEEEAAATATAALFVASSLITFAWLLAAPAVRLAPDWSRLDSGLFELPLLPTLFNDDVIGFPSISFTMHSLYICDLRKRE